MDKPEAFGQANVALHNIPYVCGDGSTGQVSSFGGVLQRGRTVWTVETYHPQRRPLSVAAFVDDLGIVSLDPRWLIRADTLQPAQETPWQSQ